MHDLPAFLINIVAGLRAFTAPTAVAWAAHLGWPALKDSWAAFLGFAWTPWIFGALAAVEYVTDQLPSTPSRTVSAQLGARLVGGTLSGAAIGASGGTATASAGGLVAGFADALVGTFGGAWARTRLAGTFGQDRPASLLEDAVTILGGLSVLGAA